MPLKLEYFPTTHADSELDSVLKERIDWLTDITEDIHFFCEIKLLEKYLQLKSPFPFFQLFF